MYLISKKASHNLKKKSRNKSWRNLQLYSWKVIESFFSSKQNIEFEIKLNSARTHIVIMIKFIFETSITCSFKIIYIKRAQFVLSIKVFKHLSNLSSPLGLRGIASTRDAIKIYQSARPHFTEKLSRNNLGKKQL